MRGAGTRGVGAHHMVLVVAIGTSPITDDGYTDQVCFSTPFTHTSLHKHTSLLPL